MEELWAILQVDYIGIRPTYVYIDLQTPMFTFHTSPVVGMSYSTSTFLPYWKCSFENSAIKGNYVLMPRYRVILLGYGFRCY